jgi:N-methylhydantoinase B
VLQDVAFISTADRSILSPYGVAGGKAALPYRAIVNPGTPDERYLPGLNDNLPLRAGDVLRLITTGGGGWGDPLEREPDMVLLDVIQGKVSPGNARTEYGVVLLGQGDDTTVDEDATTKLRSSLKKGRRPVQLIDRGPGYERLAAESR